MSESGVPETPRAEPADGGGLSRRQLLKWGGAVGAGLGIAGAAGAGFAAGVDTDSFTGFGRHYYGDGMFFDREPFRRDKPTYEKVGPTRRIKAVEYQFARSSMMMRLIRSEQWKPEQGVDALPDELRDFYKSNPGQLLPFLESRQAMKEQRADWEGRYKTRYALASAWSHAHMPYGSMRTLFPPNPTSPPEKWDFEYMREEPLEFKSPRHASELIKKIAHSFGATLVGITKLNLDWVYAENVRGGERGPYDVPKHWVYAIVSASPMEWGQMYANPTYGSSYDAYSRERVVSGKLASFIRNIGYPSRAHCPPAHYDLITPPIAIDAGLGELGRNGILVTPELGCNARLSVVTTNIPMEPDRPIDIGVSDFCNKCKICADTCPSGSISHEERPTEVVRGYKRWRINDDTCHKIWCTVASSRPDGCRVCIAVCPYTRKNNWIHTVAREADARDPSGLVSSGLLAMQKGLFDYPEAKDFLPHREGGTNATFHDGPDWLKTENWFNVEKTW